MPNRGNIGFRPVEKPDLPLLHDWLSKPHVAKWWDPAEKAISSIERHMGDDAVTPLMVCLDESAFAYMQLCELDVDRNEDNVPIECPVGTIGLDQFIGPEDKVGIGLGPRFLKLIITKLFCEGTPAVLVDPDPSNLFAIRAYEKAGFIRLRQVDKKNGPTLFMVRTFQEI
ncbi:GNAT family N-acetyltransferase [uncultured Cohaesibacter sp.]|uniref:GNAT family N-acetyltransferase n=1 Tax=uncultured Cohaesibacter sp. TaxID=1002546 RepID=UPI0029C7A80B|nr:GNAT family N-acetyltransferase [uncultured Cohaesibacter sp.]